jgi:hypothetical protein
MWGRGVFRVINQAQNRFVGYGARTGMVHTMHPKTTNRVTVRFGNVASNTDDFGALHTLGLIES